MKQEEVFLLQGVTRLGTDPQPTSVNHPLTEKSCESHMWIITAWFLDTSCCGLSHAVIFLLLLFIFLCNMIHMIHLYWGDYYFWWLIIWMCDFTHGSFIVTCAFCLIPFFWHDFSTWFIYFHVWFFFPQMWFKWNLKFKLIMNSACNYLIFAWSHTGLITCVVSEYNMLKRTFTFVCLFDIITCEKTSCDFP